MRKIKYIQINYQVHGQREGLDRLTYATLVRKRIHFDSERVLCSAHMNLIFDAVSPPTSSTNYFT